MLENASEVFDLSMIKFKKNKKVTYDQRMEAFRTQHGHYIDEMLTHIREAEDKDAAAVEAAKAFTDSAFNRYARRGKIRGVAGSDPTLFMIFYVFPAIQLTEDENAILLCDKLRDEFSVKFNNPQMGYTTFQEIRDSFSEKIFGLF